MSGIECVGLILGVMPLVIECAKAYPKATKVVRNTTRPNLSDEALETYLSELALLLREFKLQMQRIFDYLPDLGTARKIELLNDFNLEDWRPGGDVAKAFMAMFPDPDDFSWFEDIVTQVIRQMGQLIRDTQVFTQKSSTTRNTSTMFEKLKALKLAQDKSKSSGWLVRFRFNVKDADRAKSLEMVDRWVKKTGPLLLQLERTWGQSQSRERVRLPSYEHIRELVIYMYNALIDHWKCACVQQRRVKIFLDGQDIARCHAQNDVSFQLLFPKPPSTQPGVDERWLEGNVVVCPASRSGSQVKFATAPAPLAPTKESLTHLCEAIDIPQTDKYRACIEIEQRTTDPARFWKRRIEKRALETPTTPQEILLGATLTELAANPRHQLWVAVQLAHSLLLLDETPWLETFWTREHISFFSLKSSTTNFRHPLLTAHLKHQLHTTNQQRQPNLQQFHEHPSLLNLGIALIEIHLGRPIKTLLGPNKHADDVDELLQIVDSTSSFFDGYRAAVESCLRLQWKKVDNNNNQHSSTAHMLSVAASKSSTPTIISLGDPVTQKAVYEHVLLPLEQDLRSVYGGKYR